MDLDDRLHTAARRLHGQQVAPDATDRARRAVSARVAAHRRRRTAAAGAVLGAGVAIAATVVAVADDQRAQVSTEGDAAAPTTEPTVESTGLVVSTPPTPTTSAPSTTGLPETTVHPILVPDSSAVTTVPLPPTTPTTASTTTTSPDDALPFPLLADGEVPAPLPGVPDPGNAASRWMWTRPAAYAIRIHGTVNSSTWAPMDVRVWGHGTDQTVLVTDATTGLPITESRIVRTIDDVYNYVAAWFAAPVTVATGVGHDAVPAEVIATDSVGTEIARVVISQFRLL